MLISKSLWFRIVLAPFAFCVVAIHQYHPLRMSEMMFLGGLCLAITSRIVDTSFLEWKTLFIMFACSLVGLFLFQSWPTGRLLSEVILWWAIFGIPVRATLGRVGKGKVR